MKEQLFNLLSDEVEANGKKTKLARDLKSLILTNFRSAETKKRLNEIFEDAPYETSSRNAGKTKMVKYVPGKKTTQMKETGIEESTGKSAAIKSEDIKWEKYTFLDDTVAVMDEKDIVQVREENLIAVDLTDKYFDDRLTSYVSRSNEFIQQHEEYYFKNETDLKELKGLLPKYEADLEDLANSTDKSFKAMAFEDEARFRVDGCKKAIALLEGKKDDPVMNKVTTYSDLTDAQILEHHIDFSSFKQFCKQQDLKLNYKNGQDNFISEFRELMNDKEVEGYK